MRKSVHPSLLINGLPLAFVIGFLSTVNPQLTTCFAQGNLTPPGSPAPTFKTLDQIEPRVDVAKLSGDANSQVIITNAGSYYLSTNLAVTKTYGISIAAAGVTLDLNGFEVVRVSGTGGDGIRINGGSDRATVRNGSIRGFAFGINGSPSPVAKACLLEKLAVSGCGSYGILAGDSARVVDCRAHDNAGSGILAQFGSVISGCTAQENQGIYGIYGGNGSTIKGCTAQNNQGTYGIYGEIGCLITDSVAYNNLGIASSSYGIYGVGGNTIIGCVSRFNINNNSQATSTQGVGIFAAGGSTVKDCTVSLNRGDGIRVSDQCFVKGNTSYLNGNGGDGAGVHSTGLRNRIEANTVTDNDRGIDVGQRANLIIGNNAGNNAINYAISSNNRYGPIIDITANGSASVSGNSADSTVNTTDPWANFAH